jgi:respiratory burst oxidase
MSTFNLSFVFSFSVPLQATAYPGKVLALKVTKPPGFQYHSGMYVFVQCPEVSKFEW